MAQIATKLTEPWNVGWIPARTRGRLVDVHNDNLPILAQDIVNLTVVDSEPTPEIPQRRGDRRILRHPIFIVGANRLRAKP